MTTPMLSCHETFARLDDYLDRELTAEDLAAVELHLHNCTVCSEEFAVEKDLMDELRAKLRRVRAPASLRGRISALLRE